MSDPRFYRIHMRLRRTEYNDVIADLESYPASEQSARIKLLLRLGLAADAANTGGSIVVAERPVAASSPSHRPVRNERPAPATKRPGDKLDALGMDPAAFSFGAKMS